MNKTIILKNYILLNEDEHKDLLKIRNTKHIRELSLDTKEIILSKHLEWVNTLVINEDKKYYAIIYKDKIIGAINIFDINKEIKWGIFFEENASILLKSFLPIYFLSYVFKEYKINSIQAEVKLKNENALKYNKNLGFIEFFKNEEFISLSLDLESFIKRKNDKILKSIIKRMNSYEFIIKEESAK